MKSWDVLFEFIGFLRKGRRIANTTAKQYIWLLNDFGIQTGAIFSRFVEEVKREEIVRYLNHCSSKSMIKKNFLRLRIFFNYYYTLACLEPTENPFYGLRTPKASESTHKDMLTFREMQAIYVKQKEITLASSDALELQYMFMIRIHYRFALQPAELFNITFEDVNLEQGSVRAGIYEITRRELHLDNDETRLLAKWLQKRKEHYRTFHSYIFIGSGGKMMDSKAYARILKKLLKNATPRKLTNAARFNYACSGQPDFLLAKALKRTDMREIDKFYHLVKMVELMEVHDLDVNG